MQQRSPDSTAARPPSGAARDVVVALNEDLDLSRDTLCRLAASIDRWLDPAADPETLAVTLGVAPDDLRRAWRIADDAPARARRARRRAGRRDCRLLTTFDEEYPSALLCLELPPPVLFVRGRLPSRRSDALAIVGPRHSDPYGREAARLFAQEAAAAGITLVSGFAQGVDAITHRCALDVGGTTVAVLGCGIDVPYPRSHHAWKDEIAESGAVVSELPLGHPPLPWCFPIRNRIIAALAEATLVIQASPRSGSLITARLALELGRDVFAVPGRIFDRRSAGANRLLRDGALAALEPGDLLEYFDRRRRHTPDGADLAAAGGSRGRILRALERGADSPEGLAESLGVDLAELQVDLLELEMAGSIRRQSGLVERVVAGAE